VREKYRPGGNLQSILHVLIGTHDAGASSPSSISKERRYKESVIIWERALELRPLAASWILSFFAGGRATREGRQGPASRVKIGTEEGVLREETKKEGERGRRCFAAGIMLTPEPQPGYLRRRPTNKKE